MFRLSGFLICFLLVNFLSLHATRVPNALFENMRQQAAEFSRQYAWGQPDYKEGDAVMFHGLRDDSYNGLVGVVMAEKNENGRYPVRLLRYSKPNLYTREEAFKSAAFKPENLTPVIEGKTIIEAGKLEELFVELASLLKQPESMKLTAYHESLLDKKGQARVIGWFLWHHFGEEEMRYFVDRIFSGLERSAGSKRVLESAWDGIGIWLS